MKPTLGIVQPGRIGDLIISLPIAKYYHDRGWRVIWPIGEPFVTPFSYAVDYVTFLPVPHKNVTDTAHWHDYAIRTLSEFHCDKTLDLLYNMTGTGENSGRWKASGMKFDEYRYMVSEVPFDEKWKLNINRNKKKEEALFEKIVKQEKYVVYQFTGAGFHRPIKLDNKGNFQMIEITKVSNNPFDWLSIIERASKIVLLDSSFANMVEQLNFSNEKYFILRSPDIMTPTLRNEWKIV